MVATNTASLCENFLNKKSTAGLGCSLFVTLSIAWHNLQGCCPSTADMNAVVNDVLSELCSAMLVQAANCSMPQCPPMRMTMINQDKSTERRAMARKVVTVESFPMYFVRGG